MFIKQCFKNKWWWGGVILRISRLVLQNTPNLAKIKLNYNTFKSGNPQTCKPFFKRRRDTTRSDMKIILYNN